MPTAVLDSPPASAQPEAAPTTLHPQTPPARDSFFDNARLGLMLSIVVSHTMEPLNRNDAMVGLYYLQYLFHIPMLALISGFFAPRRLDSRAGMRLISGLLAPYLIFQCLYLYFDYRLNAWPAFNFSLLTPYWLLWYLLSLTWWQLLGPVINSLKWPVAWAVALAVGAGYLPEIGYGLSLQRTFVFLPFFILGSNLRREHFAWLHKPWMRALAALILAAMIWRLCRPLAWPNLSWVHGSYAYAIMKVGGWQAGALRLAHLGFCLLAGACVLSLTPRRRTVFTSLGARTLYIYLLHGFLIKGAVKAGVFRDLTAPWQVAVACAVAAVIGLLLANRWLDLLVRPLVQPPLGWLFRQERQGDGRRGA